MSRCRCLLLMLLMVVRPFLYLAASFTTSIRHLSINMSNDPYKSSSFIGHSLWLCPTGASMQAYQSIVQTASSSLDTFCFIPHITLVAAMLTSEVDVVERTKILATKLKPFEFEFSTLGQRDAYFQCVFAQMKRTPQAVRANEIARDIFPERSSDPEYMPHLSLVYGDFPLIEKENNIMPLLSKAIQEHAPATLKIPVDSIQVWSTQGDVSEWYLVETVPLTGTK